MKPPRSYAKEATVEVASTNPNPPALNMTLTLTLTLIGGGENGEKRTKEVI